MAIALWYSLSRRLDSPGAVGCVSDCYNHKLYADELAYHADVGLQVFRRTVAARFLSARPAERLKRKKFHGETRTWLTASTS